jgi:DNA-binding beta-propeller fold protein YncE
MVSLLSRLRALNKKCERKAKIGAERQTPIDQALFMNGKRLINGIHRDLIPVAATAAVLFLAGCASPKGPKTHVFFPPPPDEARIQFLTSFSSEEGLQGDRTFTDFVVGTEKYARPIVKPYGITTVPGKLYICDTVPATIEVVELGKRRMRYFKPAGDGTLGTPINIAVDADSTRYITDTKRGQVLVFQEENYVGAIGARDEMKPAGVALTKDRIYVTDLKNHSVRVYNKANRELLFSFPKADSDEKARLFAPTNVTIDKQGSVYVSDTGGFFVNVYDAEGNYLRTMGEQGLSPGKFSLPKGVAVDREGKTYVVDANTQVIQLFDPTGRILMYFGDPAQSGGGATSLPACIAIDYDNVRYFQSFAAPTFKLEYLIFITNQTGGHKISVFGFGRKK